MEDTSDDTPNGVVQRTHFADILPELNAGAFEGQVSFALSEVAEKVLASGKPGEVTLTFKVKQIEASNQVAIHHKVKYVAPLRRGKITEEQESSTPMYVGAHGRLTIFPDKQSSMDLGSGAATGRTDKVGSNG